jgi:processive 1,2-diacylglycerol beta-glucosyltransferase
MKILVIHASAGAGHKKAAEALALGISHSTGHECVCLDALDKTSPYYKNLYTKSYTILIKYVPWLWGAVFQLVDLRPLIPLVRFIRRIFNSINGRGLADYLQKEEFDYIISTHFFANEVAGYLKRTGKIRSKLICVVTDYDAHSIWVAKGVDRYCVACQETLLSLLSFGIPRNNISVTGIPTDQRFAQHASKEELRRKLQLDEKAFTILIATGSFGFGPIEQIIKELEGFQVVVICGNNKTLYQRLNAIAQPQLKVCGLVDNMFDWMAASDLMVSKPGGLSISEALVSDLPLIFFNAIPGQETNNIKVLKKYEIGISDCTIQQMSLEAKRFRSFPEPFNKSRENLKRLARPQAVADIIKLIA